MKLSEVLSVILLITVATAPVLFMGLKILSLLTKDRESSRREMSLIQTQESARFQTMLNLMLSRDLPMFAGLQSQTVNQQNETSSQTSGSRVIIDPNAPISRDDVSEYRQLMNLYGTPMVDPSGLGEVIFDDDPDGTEALAELFGQGMISSDGEVQ